MDKLVVEVLAQQHLDQATKLLAKTFIISNPVWKHYNLSYDDISVIMRGKLLKALDICQSFVLFQGDKLIAVTVHLDMLDYVTFPAMPNNLEFFKKLAKVGEALECSVDITGVKRGEIVVGVYAVMDPDYASKGYSIYFWWLCMTIGKLAGWKTYYSRSSNIFSRKGIQRIGGQIVKQYQLVDGDIKQKFWLMRIDLTKPSLSYSQLKKILSQKKQPKSKL